MKVRHALATLFLLQLVAGVSAAEAQGRRNRNVITQEEIEKSSATDAYDLIKRLRPQWFTRRGVASGRVTTDAGGGLDDRAEVVAYVDGIRTGDLTAIAVELIKEVRFLSASDATTVAETPRSGWTPANGSARSTTSTPSIRASGLVSPRRSRRRSRRRSASSGARRIRAR